MHCNKCNNNYEGITNEDNIICDYTLKECQENFHNSECFTHKFNIYKQLEIIIDAGNYSDEDLKSYKQYRSDFVKSRTVYECGNQYENDCNFSGNLSQILDHEKTCMGIKPSNECDDSDDAKLDESNWKTIKCELCNKSYYNYPNRKMDIKYQLAAHKKICKKSYKKKRRRLLIEFLKESDQDIIDKLFIKYKDVIEE